MIPKGERAAVARNLLLGPGPTLHELAHLAVGRRYGDVELDVGLLRSQVAIDWDDRVPVWGVFGFFLAPLLLAGIVALAAAPFVGLFAVLPEVAKVWLVVNYVLLAGLSGVDVVELLAVVAKS